MDTRQPDLNPNNPVLYTRELETAHYGVMEGVSTTTEFHGGRKIHLRANRWVPTCLLPTDKNIYFKTTTCQSR